MLLVHYGQLQRFSFSYIASIFAEEEIHGRFKNVLARKLKEIFFKFFLILTIKSYHSLLIKHFLLFY